MASFKSPGPVRFVPQHGMSSQSPATQHLIATAVGNYAVSGGTRRTKKKRARAAGTAKRAKRSGARKATARRTTARSSRGAARLVKGSAAAKRYMAKIRKLKK